MPNDTIMPEEPGQNGLSADSPSVVLNPESFYSHSRLGFDGYLATIRDESLRGKTTDYLTKLSYGSSAAAARHMRQASAYIWSFNSLYSWLGISHNTSQTPLQKIFNHKLCTHNADGTLNTITSDNLAPLFPEGREKDWPNLVLTSNHARAWVHEDISEIMQGFKRTMIEAGVPESSFCRLTSDMSPAQAKGKNILVAAVHSQKDPFLNGADLIDRRLELEQRPEGQAGLMGEREYMSPAAMRLSKLIFKLMCEPASYPLVRLDCSRTDDSPQLKAHPMVADYVALSEKESTNLPSSEDRPLILRRDAARIASHIRAIGYSKGSNTVTDALRFLYQELKTAQSMTAIRQPDRTLRPLTDNDIKTLISSIALLSIAPGEVELTSAEHEIAGITRTTILNHNDIVAGQYTHYSEQSYDRLFAVNGDHKNAGHDPLEALGNAAQLGFIMNPDHAKGIAPRALEFQRAQAAVRQFIQPMLGRDAARIRA